MKRTYWYLAVTGISGALITVAIADNAAKSSSADASKSTRERQFFSRTGGNDGVSGSVADTGNEDDPLRIVPTASEPVADDEFDSLLRGDDRAPAGQTEPALYERPSRERSAAGDEADGDIVPTGGIFNFGRGRSRSSSSEPAARPAYNKPTPAKSARAPESDIQPQRMTIERTEEVAFDADFSRDRDESPRRTASEPAFDDFGEEPDALTPFDPLDERADDEPLAAPEARDPSFTLEDDARDLIEFELDRQERVRAEEAAVGSARVDDLQNLFDEEPEHAARLAPKKQLKATPASLSSGPAGVQSATFPENSALSAPMTSAPIAAVPVSAEAVTPSISLTWVKHGTVNLGQPAACDLVVKNSGNTVAENVNVDIYVPLTVRMTKAEPPAEEQVDHLTWAIPALEPQKEFKIQIEMIPNERGAMPLSANVRFSGTAKTSFTVQEPMLKLAVDGPTGVLLGDAASQIITVSNPGSGIAHNVVLECKLTDGLNHKKGREFKLEIGSLEGGETRQYRLPIETTAGGMQTVNIVAQAAGGLSDVSESLIDVSAPALEATVAGPGFRYLQRSATYAVTVKNSGKAESNNVRVLYAIPAGFRLLAAGQGGRYNAQENSVVWYLGQIASEQSRELTLDLKAVESGEFTHEVTVVSDGSTTLNASTSTEVEGFVDLVLDVNEGEDPVELGTDAVYDIVVRNDGTKAASNVALSCVIPAGLEFQSATGPSEHTSTLGDVSFGSIPTLKPGESVSFRVIVRGVTAGQHRLRAQLNSDSLSEPLVDEELTRFYGE